MAVSAVASPTLLDDSIFRKDYLLTIYNAMKNWPREQQRNFLEQNIADVSAMLPLLDYLFSTDNVDRTELLYDLFKLAFMSISQKGMLGEFNKTISKSGKSSMIPSKLNKKRKALVVSVKTKPLKRPLIRPISKLALKPDGQPGQGKLPIKTATSKVENPRSSQPLLNKLVNRKRKTPAVQSRIMKRTYVSTISKLALEPGQLLDLKVHDNVSFLSIRPLVPPSPKILTGQPLKRKAHVLKSFPEFPASPDGQQRQEKKSNTAARKFAKAVYKGWSN